MSARLFQQAKLLVTDQRIFTNPKEHKGHMVCPSERSHRSPFNSMGGWGREDEASGFLQLDGKAG